MIKKTKYASYCINQLPEGCKLCVKGRKLVLFISGKCMRKCFYCPLSEKRKGIDAVWANERKLSNVNAVSEAIEEARLCGAKGAGITGGDPLLFVSRVCKFVQVLKKKFGKTFHIHIYLPTNLITKQKLKKLADSEIDEVRFHPLFLKQDFESEIKKIIVAKQFKWQVGIEIPALPDKEKETLRFIESALPLLDFININELELSDTNLEMMSALGYHAKKDSKRGETGYVVEGSQETALKILKRLDKVKPAGLRVHYCSAATKNLFQYKNRLMLRAKNILEPYDILTPRFTLYRGALYPKDKDKKIESKILILKKLGLSKKFIGFDKEKQRIFIPVGFALEFKEKLKQNFKVALVEELPTYDNTLIQSEFL